MMYEEYWTMQKSVISLPTQPSTMAGRTNHRTTKTCHRACLSATADLADTKNLNILSQRKRNDRIEKKSQTIERQERPVGNTG